jgi:NAD(P)H-nitrite reductase large subunit
LKQLARKHRKNQILAVDETELPADNIETQSHVMSEVEDSMPHTDAGSSDREICHCLRVTESQVRESIAVHNCETIREVTRSCGAGGGCTACHRHIRRCLMEQMAHVQAVECR